MLKTFTIKFIPSEKHECRVDLTECRERTKHCSMAERTSNVHKVEFKLPSFHHAVVASNEVVARFSNIDYSTQESIRVVSISESYVDSLS